MSVIPQQPAITAYYTGARPVPPPKRARSRGTSYTPGMFDTLIDRPVCGPGAPTTPAQLRGVTIELAASGRSVMLAEQLRSGTPGQRHMLTLEEAYSVFLIMADGREVWIEVRAVAQVPEEDREPWTSGAEQEESAPAPVVAPAGAFSCPDFTPRILVR